MKFTVIGCGGMGFWTSAALLNMGHEIVVWDNDSLEGTGGQRLPAFAPFGYRPPTKVELLRALFPHNPRLVTVNARFANVTSEMYSDADFVIDTTDADDEVRRQIMEPLGERYIRASYDVVGQRLIVVVARGLGFGTNHAGGYTNPPTAAQAQAAGGLVASVLHRLAGGEDIRLPWKVEVEEE